MCLTQQPQHSDAGEARTSGPSVSSQALYLWATALPLVTICDRRAKINRIFDFFENWKRFQNEVSTYLILL